MEKSSSSEIHDYYNFSLIKKENTQSSNANEGPFFKEDFFSRFFCFFCLNKPKKTIATQKKENKDQKNTSTTILNEENPSKIDFSHYEQSEAVYQSKIHYEKSRFSGLFSAMPNKNLFENKNISSHMFAFPSNKCFFLSYQEKYYVLCRIQHKKLHFYSKKSVSHNPEIFCHYIAQKMQMHNFVNILQFGAKSTKQIKNIAKNCDFLYVAEQENKKIAKILSKIKIDWKTQQNIEFIQTNNLSSVYGTGTYFSNIDLIFINPEWKINHKEKESFIDIQPNFPKILREALKITQNVVVCLPIYINLNEIAKVVHEFSELNLIKNDRNSVEFDFIYFNKKIEKIMMFLGKSNTITHQECNEFYSNFIQEGFKSEGQTQEFQDILAFLNKRIGFSKLCNMIPLIKKSQIKYESKSLLQNLIDNLLDYCYITKEELNEFLCNKTMNNLQPSYNKESLDSTSCRLIKKNSHKLTKNKSSLKKLKKKVSLDNTYLSSYSNCTGIFNEGSSYEDFRQEFTHKLYKIEEVSHNNTKNSGSLKYESVKSPFYEENHHETFG